VCRRVHCGGCAGRGELDIAVSALFATRVPVDILRTCSWFLVKFLPCSVPSYHAAQARGSGCCGCCLWARLLRAGATTRNDLKRLTRRLSLLCSAATSRAARAAQHQPPQHLLISIAWRRAFWRRSRTCAAVPAANIAPLSIASPECLTRGRRKNARLDADHRCSFSTGYLPFPNTYLHACSSSPHLVKASGILDHGRRGAP